MECVRYSSPFGRILHAHISKNMVRRTYSVPIVYETRDTLKDGLLLLLWLLLLVNLSLTTGGMVELTVVCSVVTGTFVASPLFDKGPVLVGATSLPSLDVDENMHF
jgi:hypothetical protein